MMSTFASYLVRSASTTAPARANVKVSNIMQAADWGTELVF